MGGGGGSGGCQVFAGEGRVGSAVLLIVVVFGIRAIGADIRGGAVVGAGAGGGGLRRWCLRPTCWKSGVTV